jgi:hypothetical protein
MTMIVDAQLIFSDDQVLVASAASDDIVDLGIPDQTAPYVERRLRPRPQGAAMADALLRLVDHCGSDYWQTCGNVSRIALRATRKKSSPSSSRCLSR